MSCPSTEDGGIEMTLTGAVQVRAYLDTELVTKLVQNNS